MTVGPDGLRALARKYRRMGELRRGTQPDEELRALAVEFPGALRELDTLPTEIIDERATALERAADGGALEPWMAWMHGYHALMRAALAIKRRLATNAPLGPDERGAIARATGVTVDEALVAAVATPPHGRLNVVVFDRLGLAFATAPKIIWDALFPPRKGERAYRNR